MIEYDESATLRQAREHYFAASGFSEASYTDPHVRFPIGPITLTLPNPPARQKRVPLHDLHHILTGYETTWLGEAEVSAWELASGGTPYFPERLIILSAPLVGLFINARAVRRAYRRGRGSRNLFRLDFQDAMLEARVDELRQSLNVRPSEPARATQRDKAS